MKEEKRVVIDFRGWWKIVLFAVVMSLFVISAKYLYHVISFNWGLTALMLVLVFFIIAFKMAKLQSLSLRELVLLAVFIALATVGRVIFASVPNVQPITFLVIIIGYVFGPGFGFVTGAMSALVSNFFLGQGLWTPWQMVAWGLGGVISGLVGKRLTGYPIIFMTVFSFIWGFVFDWMMNIWMWLSFYYPLTLKSLWVLIGSGLLFDVFHSVGNAVFALAAGPFLYRVLVNLKGKGEG